MPKPELGTKRTCLACGARFYDFGKTVELACPACGAAFDLEQVARARRPRNPIRALAAGAGKPADVERDEEDVDESLDVEEAADVDEVEEVDEADEVDDVDEADAEVEEPDVAVDDEDEEDPLIEDADELGDDDALGEVIDPDVGEEDDRR